MKPNDTPVHPNSTQGSALRLVASVFGVLAGLGGIRHAIGEISQGSAPPDGIIIDSWTEGPIAAHMDGEPAMTLVPNMLATGLLALAVSVAVVLWAGFFLRSSRDGWVLVLLSVAMLLVGGGFGPPVVGVLAGIAGTRIQAPALEHPADTRAGLDLLLARMWPWTFAVAVASGAFVFVASLLLVYLAEFHNSSLVLYSFYATSLFVVLSTLTGSARDRLRRGQTQAEAKAQVAQ